MGALLFVDLELAEWFERHSHILYPALAVAALLAIAIGVLQAWRSEDLQGIAKTDLKRLLITELRRQIHGCSGEELARRTRMDMHRVLGLLEEMQKDGVVVSFTSTQRLTIWRLKGIGG